ncbi:hypothetical protein AVEN_27221-1 [Araneus ventricosus]|uniref:Uncharacterized protein n=1 Tax=Araneus ventricosus TaxID=182803 RepID=A0A4Y2C9W8_ARAVE|nr:hypothetical protein AVEN_27221-1 [Araneus ventricosus]
MKLCCVLSVSAVGVLLAVTVQVYVYSGHMDTCSDKFLTALIESSAVASIHDVLESQEISNKIKSQADMSLIVRTRQLGFLIGHENNHKTKHPRFGSLHKNATSG